MTYGEAKLIAPGGRHHAGTGTASWHALRVPELAVVQADGRKFASTDLEGRVTIVTFFASWCGVCRRELPRLDELYRGHKEKGIRVLAIGVDTDQSASREMAESQSLSFDVACEQRWRSW